MATDEELDVDIAGELGGSREEEQAILKSWSDRLDGWSEQLQQIERDLKTEEQKEEEVKRERGSNGDRHMGASHVDTTLTRLGRIEETLSSVEVDLRELMESPRLKHLMQEGEEEEEDDDGELKEESREAIKVFSRCQTLHFTVQDLSGRLEVLANSLRGHKENQKDSILKDLEEFESWLQQAYDTILREPSRHLYPPSLLDEDILRAQSQTSILTEGEATTSRTGSAMNGADTAGTDGVATEEARGQDEQAAEVAEGTGSGCGQNNHPSVGESISQENGVNENNSDQVGIASVQQIEPDAASEDISPTESGETEEGVSSEWTQSGSEAESLSWIRALHILPVVHELPSLPTPPPASPSSTSTSSSLWDLRRGSTGEVVDLDHLVAELKKLSGDLPIRSQKVKKLTANIHYVIHSVPAESADEYRGRLHVLQARWDKLEAELKSRVAELTFEKEQKNILESMHEAVHELENQPFTNLLQEEVEEKYTDLMDFIIDEDQFCDMKENQLRSLEESLQNLEDLSPESSHRDKWRETVETISQGYDTLEKRVKEHKLFLEKCRELWKSFQQCYSGCCQWLDGAESLVDRETYGYSLADVKSYMKEIAALKQTIQSEEEKGAELVSLGKTMLMGMEENGEAENYIDSKLSEFETRLADLVTPGKGRIETRETDVGKVITDWEGYTGMVSSIRTFISQMTKMVGPEPKQTSQGNATLIPKYVTYRNQIRSMEVQYKRVVAFGSGLASNTHVENRSLFAQELKDLEGSWAPLKDNICDTLDLLIREYNDWMLVKLQHMNDLVSQGQTLVQQAQTFVTNYPLTDVLSADVDSLLRETDKLVADQEVLSQLETECSNVEEQLLEKQIQQETAEGFFGSQNDLEYASTTAEKDRLQEARERVQSEAGAIVPVLSVMYMQLQLLQNVQGALKLINEGLDYVGTQKECERHLSVLEEELSSDRFDRLKSQVYDVGTMVEEALENVEAVETPACFPKENYNKMLSTNKFLSTKLEKMQKSSEEACTRLQVIVQWWEEFQDNYSDIVPWLESAESDLNELSRRHKDDRSPRFSPITLLQQVKSLHDEVEEKSVVVCAVESTSGNILEEMSLKEVNPQQLPGQAEFVRAKWEELREKIRHLVAELEPSAESFQAFLSQMSQFLSWLSTYYARVYDDFCLKVPKDASQEVVGQMMNQLEVYRAELIKKQPEQKSVWDESEKWAEFNVPEDVLSELPSPPEISPDPPTEDDDRTSESTSDTPPLPLVKLCMEKANQKWWRVRQMLEEREAELERCSGSYQLFTQQAEKLLEWLQEKLDMNALAEPPPADLGVVEGYHKEVKVTRAELELKLASMRALQHMGSELRGQVNSASIAHLEEMLSKMEHVWEEVTTTTETRQEVLEPLVEHLREYNKVSSRFEAWLKEKEVELAECGPIGANLDRCIEQETILAELYEVFMGNKNSPEEVLREVNKLHGLCGAESEARIKEEVAEMERRFNAMFEDTEERIERCEQAKAAMQKLLKEIKKFEEWVDKMEEALKERMAVKKPIGTVQTEIDEHFDFMRDIETHTEEYCVLVPPGRELMEEYQPSDWMANVMQQLHNKWFGYVDNLLGREEFLVTLLKKWDKYEGEVKELLGWIMSEADSFSKDVTTYGEKGIVDHMETCKNFMEILQGKKDHIDDLCEQAAVLKEEDAQKKNGTSDVESRWNDVQMHWNSSCKLLTETLLHLEATEAEMRHVLQIRGEEFEWLEECEFGAAVKRRTHGNLELLHHEIERHESLLQETLDHDEARQFILSTVPFLVEHSRIKDREDMTVKAEDFNSRHKNLRTSLEEHTVMLKNSVPFWEKFNTSSKDLEQWLHAVNSDLESDKVQFGNATVTEQSLKFCQELQVDINARNPDLMGVVMLGEELSKYVVPEDLEFVSSFVQSLQKTEEHVNKETVEKTELLEERLKSWRVFPVEEARVVQEFLDQVKEDEQDGGVESWDDLSSEELLERLEKLENLQKLKTSNEDKVQTIDQSARSEDVQRALKKNPDISKERSNLLQGWSNVSGSLSERIMVTRKKAEVVQALERAAADFEETALLYQQYLDSPLPPSVILATSYKELQDKLVPVHNACMSSLSSFDEVLRESHQSVESIAGVTVPKHFDNKAIAYQEKFSRLVESSGEWKAKIADSVAAWEEFNSTLSELDDWIGSQDMELESLQVLEEFANEFSSHQVRLNMLRDDIESHRPSYNSLVASSPHHTRGEEPEVKEVLRQYTRIETLWNRITSSVEELMGRSKPWAEFTDRFDEFCVWIQRLEKKVQSGEDEVAAMAEEEGGNLSDRIVLFKGYLLQVTEQEENLNLIKEGAESLLTPESCDRHEECQTLKEECDDVDERWHKMKDRLEQSLVRLDQKEATWKRHAKSSILQVGRLKQEVKDYEKKLRDQDMLIDQLRKAPPPSRPSSPVCRHCVPVISVVVVVLALAFMFIKKEQTQFRPL